MRRWTLRRQGGLWLVDGPDIGQDAEVEVQEVAERQLELEPSEPKATIPS